MVPSEKILEFLREKESLRLKAYVCPAGKLTVGYGHVILPGENKFANGITKQQAKDLFRADVLTAAYAVNRFFKDAKLTQGQFDAAVSFTFNAGAGALQKAEWAKKLRMGNVTEAAELLMNWGHKQWAVAPGLKTRRAIEAAMLLGEDDGE